MVVKCPVGICPTNFYTSTNVVDPDLLASWIRIRGNRDPKLWKNLRDPQKIYWQILHVIAINNAIHTNSLPTSNQSKNRIIKKIIVSTMYRVTSYTWPYVSGPLSNVSCPVYTAVQ